KTCAPDTSASPISSSNTNVDIFGSSRAPRTRVVDIERPEIDDFQSYAHRDQSPRRKAPRILRRRQAEDARIVAAELRRAVVADVVAGGGGVEPVADHQAARFLHSQLRAELQRAHRGNGLEVFVEARAAHAGDAGDFVDAADLGEVRADPHDRARDLALAAVGLGHRAD
ncbi:hypothetical protein CATMIT_02008, partial [Catenibacterium mitsuokai DSM 15897]